MRITSGGSRLRSDEEYRKGLEKEETRRRLCWAAVAEVYINTSTGGGRRGGLEFRW